MESFNKLAIETPAFTAKILVFDSLDFCAILLSGSMEPYLASQLREKVNSATVGKRYNYLVDLDGLTFISSNGLGFLLYLAKNQRQFVYLSRPGPAVIKPFDLLGIQHLFRYFHSIQELEGMPGIPLAVLSPLWMEKKVLSAALHQKQWVKILKEHLASRELTREIQGMSSYLEDAETKDTIVLPAGEKFVSVLYKFLERAFARAEERGAAPLDAPTIELVAKELMANAIKHGYGYQSGGKVQAGFGIDQNSLVITFTDHGRGYAPVPNGQDELPSAGIELLRRIFDELEIGQAPQKLSEGLVLGPGTMLRMVKHLGSKTAQAVSQPPGWWQRLIGLFRKG